MYIYVYYDEVYICFFSSSRHRNYLPLSRDRFVTIGTGGQFYTQKLYQYFEGGMYAGGLKPTPPMFFISVTGGSSVLTGGIEPPQPPRQIEPCTLN